MLYRSQCTQHTLAGRFRGFGDVYCRIDRALGIGVCRINRWAASLGILRDSNYHEETKNMNRHEVHLLQQISGYPALTITLPTHRTSPENRQDPIRVKNLVEQAATRLLEEFSRREIAPLLNQLD